MGPQTLPWDIFNNWVEVDPIVLSLPHPNGPTHVSVYMHVDQMPT